MSLVSAGGVAPLATLPLIGAQTPAGRSSAKAISNSVAKSAEELILAAQPPSPLPTGSGLQLTQQSVSGDRQPSAVLGTVAAAPATIAVHAAGAVLRPAVYELPAGARVDDVIRAAGGVSPDADVDALNLAAHLADGERVFVPRKGQPVPSVVVGDTGDVVPAASPGASGSVSVGGSQAGPKASTPTIVNLNSATSEQLDALPGIGPATASKIIDYRTQHGAFKSVDQLLDVPGIGDAKLATLKPHLRVG